VSKSGRVRLSDLRRAYRLIHECRDLGHDPAAWARHATEGVSRLAEAQIVLLFELQPPTPESPPANELLADCGWSSGGQRALWERLYKEEKVYAHEAITFTRFLVLPHTFLTRSREQLVDDREWHSSFEFNELHRALRFGDAMWSARWEEGRRIFGFGMMRPPAEEPFGARQRRLVHLFHDELWRYLGTALVRRPNEPFARLPPRLREVLDCLLEGDGEKQVAARLGLSRHTVHEYVGQLYRRFGVCSRPELLALCLRLGGPRTTQPSPLGWGNKKG
jgi:DNA-binding CsgD family transcriptional regulator